ncbi:MAG: hypothetical protein IKT53_05920 [Bacteroidaceae bacterium]|nr:hypothetical protein [Bacteroidaceae bacterium]
MDKESRQPSQSEIIIDIVKSELDANSRISLSKMQELLSAVEFDVTSHGFSDLRELLEQLQEAFLLIETEDSVMVECLGVKVEKPVAEKTQTSTTPAAPAMPADDGSVKYATLPIVKKLINDAGGIIALTNIGQEFSKQGIKMRNGEKLSAFLKQHPELEVVAADGQDYVRMAKKSGAAPQQAVLVPQPTTQKRFVSLYNIADFACFSDYQQTIKELAEMAAEDGWFVLPDANEKSPYFLVNYKFRIAFALAVRKQLAGEDGGFVLRIDSAEFDTGFVTPDGKRIKAYFKLNQQRDNTCWQTWCFERFDIE